MRGEKEGREECLGEEERAEGVGGKGAEENAVRGGFQAVLLVRSHGACRTETASATEPGLGEGGGAGILRRCSIPAMFKMRSSRFPLKLLAKAWIDSSDDRWH